MAGKIIILKNSTAAEIKVRSIGVIIAATQSAQCSYAEILALEDSQELIDFINAGTIIVNNGLVDLSKPDALSYISVTAPLTQNYYTKNDVDNAINSSVSTNITPITNNLTTNYYTQSQVDAKIAAIQGSGINGAVNYYSQLPSTGNKIGDVYIVRSGTGIGSGPIPFPVDGQTGLYLPFDTTWKDSLGHTSTQVGTSTLVNGKLNKAGDFNGSSYSVFTANNAFGTGTALTVGGWIYVRRTGTYGIIDHWSNATCDGEGWKFEVVGNKLRVCLDPINNEYSGQTTLIDQNNITQNTWTHIAFTYNNGNIILYINAIPVNSIATYPGYLGADSISLYVGRTSDGDTSKYYNGLMDDFFIENRMMSRTELENLVYSSVTGYHDEGFYRWDGEWTFLARNTGDDATALFHNDLLGLDSLDYQHLTLENKTQLIGGGTTSLHNHDSLYHTKASASSTFAPLVHNHDSSYYTKAQVDSLSTTIDYSVISSHDANTNVTGAELEILTNGSNADSLHTHNFSSLINGKGLNDAYNNHNASQPGVGRTIVVNNGPVTLQASNGVAPLRLNTINYTPTWGLGGGEICYYDGELFVYDSVRGYFLSVSTTTISGGSSASNIKNTYLVGNVGVFSTNVGWLMPWNGTIVAASITSESSNTQSIEIRKNGSSIHTLYYNNSTKSYASNISTHFNAGDSISFYVAGSNSGCTRPLVWVHIKRRI